MKVRKQYKECKKLKISISSTEQFNNIKIFNINILELNIRSHNYHNNHYTTRLALYQICIIVFSVQIRDQETGDTILNLLKGI